MEYTPNPVNRAHVRAYLGEIREADADFADQLRPHSDKFSEAIRGYEWGSAEYRAACQALDEARAELLAACNARKAAAQQKLIAAVNDPLVPWMFEHCAADGYPDHVLDVIKHLPATLDQLDQLADDEGWCGVWDDYRTRAIRDGVVTESGLTPARSDLHAYIRAHVGGLRGRTRTRLDAMVDKVVAAALAAE